MILSITYAIEPKIEDEWLVFAKNNHIPALEQSYDFEHIRFTKVIPEEKMDTAFNLQLKFKNQEELNTYMKYHGNEIHQELLKAFNGKMAMFTTLLKEVL
jgi:hypothetical protein